MYRGTTVIVCETENCVYNAADGFTHCHQCLAKIQQDLIKKVRNNKTKEKDYADKQS